jgi:hypothetical protein
MDGRLEALMSGEVDMAGRQPRETTLRKQATNIIPFPHPHRGDPEPRREALAGIGFRWARSVWGRGRVVLTDEAIDAMDEGTWASSLRRWTRRRPQRRD